MVYDKNMILQFVDGLCLNPRLSSSVALSDSLSKLKTKLNPTPSACRQPYHFNSVLIY